MRTLYFCSIRQHDRHGQTVSAGHYLAENAADARRIAGEHYTRLLSPADLASIEDREQREKLVRMIAEKPALDKCVVIATKSNADISNALNAKGA